MMDRDRTASQALGVGRHHQVLRMTADIEKSTRAGVASNVDHDDHRRLIDPRREIACVFQSDLGGRIGHDDEADRLYVLRRTGHPRCPEDPFEEIVTHWSVGVGASVSLVAKCGESVHRLSITRAGSVSHFSSSGGSRTSVAGMPQTEHADVIVVGAGISGISAACHLQERSPDRSYMILEGRSDLGGTWDLFRYPGVRSDSDMHTLGFSFKPWKAAKSIADGPSILDYLRETANEHDIEGHIRFDHLVTTAEWSTETSTWTLTADVLGVATTYSCNFLFMCSGYYSYKGGYTPDFAGIEDFTGRVVHPQAWPEDLDYENKKVVVIGSGATAVTLVPAMADKAQHVTMLQRSPTYMVSRPDVDVVAQRLRKVLPEKLAYRVTRKKNTFRAEMVYKKTRTNPDEIKQLLLGGVKQGVGDDVDIAKHFTPSYNPWDQRLCLVPNSDFFESIRTKAASVVTDTIDRFTAKGIRLSGGEELEADIVVTATGLQLVTLGDMDFFVDGERVDFSRTWTYRGLGYSDVPNLVSTFGYINASWTLRADLISEYVCRLLNHMTSTGTVQCTPRLRPSDRNMPRRDWIEDFSSGYMQRMMPLLPKQGDREPWINSQRYSPDKKMIRKSSIEDGVMQFTSAKVPART